jgi:hypothetical protein
MEPDHTDRETGLPDGRRLLADLEHRPAEPFALELIALRAPDGVAQPFLLADDPDLASRMGAELRATAENAGGYAYSVGSTVFALVTPAGVGPALQHRLGATAPSLNGSLVQARVDVPQDVLPGRAALVLGMDRLRGRSGVHPLSPARQSRDVLLQLLAARDVSGVGARRPHVAAHAVAVARRLGLSLEQIDVLVRAAELQDVGKLVLPDSVLTKEGALTPEEWEVVRGHPIAGEKIIAAAPALEPVARLVRSCYERFDGSGYPDRLHGEDIPLGARIIAVCVAYDAMTSKRPYREPLSPAAAVAELQACAGRQFDPDVVAAFRAVADVPAEPAPSLAGASV